jgi:hypothetical protein
VNEPISRLCLDEARSSPAKRRASDQAGEGGFYLLLVVMLATGN